MLPGRDTSRSALPSDGPGAFPTTHWSIVLTARNGEDPRAANALDALCGAYWYPLYVFIRRHGQDPHGAQDLTQGFFEHLLAHQSIARVERERGRFRSFLLAALKYYLADQRAYAHRQKRGGGQPHFSLDAVTGEARYRLEPVDHRTPEQLFERRWALELLDRTLARLGREYAAAEDARLFETLQPFLAGKDRAEPYAAVAARLGRSEDAVKKLVQRMRRRYQELIREEIAHTVSDPGQVEDELRHLCEVIGRG